MANLTSRRQPTTAAAPVAVLAMLSLRYWRRRSGRAAAGVFGIALGVALVVSVIAVNQAVLRGYAGWVEMLSGGGLVEVRAVETGGVTADILRVIRAAPGVAAAGGVVEQRSYLFTEQRQAPAVVRGVEVAVEPLIRPLRLAAGRQLEAGDGAATVLSAAAAAALGVGVGEHVSLLSADGLLELRVVGINGTLEVGGLARERSAVIPLRTAQDAFMQGRDVVTQVDVVPASAGDMAGLKATLAPLVEPQALVRLPADEVQDLTSATRGLRSLLLLAGVMALVAAVFLIGNNLAAGVEERGRDLGIVRALGLPGRVTALWFLAEAAVLGATGSLLGAVLGAVGANGLMSRLPNDLAVPVAHLPGSVGVDLNAASVGAGVGLLVTLLATLPLAVRAARRPVVVAAGLAPLASTGGVVRAGAARRSLAPATLVTLLTVAALALALEHRSGLAAWPPGEGTGQAALVMVAVLVFTVALVRSFPAVFGSLSDGVRSMAAPPLWLRLATDSLRRHARRTGATAVSLSITLASLVGVYGAADSYRLSLEAWLDAAVTWDLLVTGGAQGGVAVQPLPAAALTELAAVPGVVGVLPERVVTVSAGGRAVILVAYDAAAPNPSRKLLAVRAAPGVAVTTKPSLATGLSPATETSPTTKRSLATALVDDGGLALSLAVAARLGVDAGDELRLTTPSGERGFTVIALVEDRAAESPGAYIDAGVYAEAFGDPVVDQIGVLLAPGTDATGTIPDLAGSLYRLLGEHYPVQVVSAAAFRQDVLDDVGAAFAVVRTLVLLAVLVALVGLLNAMLIGFWQLRYQFGLLRAIGAPATIFVRTLATEVLLTTLAGAGTGVILGTLLSVALLRGLERATGPLLTWSPPLDAYLTVALLLSLAALVGGSLLLGRARVTPVAAVVRGE